MTTNLRAPDPPSGDRGDGDSWMERLAGTGWYPVSTWGREGWVLGRWPQVIVTAYDPLRSEPWVYGMAVYVEGDVDITSYATREERDNAIDLIAAFYWRQYWTGPDDLPGDDAKLKAHHRGPFTLTRLEAQ
jgi:hypothetical protein